MPRPSLERLSAWVWLINGLVLLAVLAFAGIWVAAGWLRAQRAGPAGPVGGESAPGAAAAPRSPRVRHDGPYEIPGAGTRLVLLREGRGLPSGPPPPAAAYRAGGPLVNVAFLEQAGGGRLLLDRPGRILWISFPGAAEWLAGPLGADPGQREIIYAIVSADSDGDGRLDPRDDAGLFASALNGTGLRPLLPEGHRLESIGRGGAEWMIFALAPADASGARPLRAFRYEPGAISARPEPSVDSLSARAGELLEGR